MDLKGFVSVNKKSGGLIGAIDTNGRLTVTQDAIEKAGAEKIERCNVLVNEEKKALAIVFDKNGRYTINGRINIKGALSQLGIKLAQRTSVALNPEKGMVLISLADIKSAKK